MSAGRSGAWIPPSGASKQRSGSPTTSTASSKSPASPGYRAPAGVSTESAWSVSQGPTGTAVKQVGSASALVNRYQHNAAAASSSVPVSRSAGHSPPVTSVASASPKKTFGSPTPTTTTTVSSKNMSPVSSREPTLTTAKSVSSQPQTTPSAQPSWTTLATKMTSSAAKSPVVAASASSSTSTSTQSTSSFAQRRQLRRSRSAESMKKITAGTEYPSSSTKAAAVSSKLPESRFKATASPRAEATKPREAKKRPRSAERPKPAAAQPSKPVREKAPTASTEAEEAKFIRNEVGSSGAGTYTARIVGTKEQQEVMDKDDKMVTMYVIEVTKGGKSWTIFRRFNQFELMERNLRKHGAWPRTQKLLPKSGRPAERLPALQAALSQYLSASKVQESNFMFAFIEPVQLGDLKR